MCIVANKYPQVRCALCHDVEAAEMSRKHNNSNMLSLAADKIDEPLALRIVKVWLETEFEGGRHQKRIDKINAIEDQRPEAGKT